mgnify:CR=1 FL=1
MFAPVARFDTIRMIISLTAQNKWRIYQMDVKSTFLNGILNEEIYVQQLARFYYKKVNKIKCTSLRGPYMG